MRKVMLFAAIWIFTPTLVSADMATVTSGEKSEITTHMRYDRQCQASRVAIKILAAPANGTVTAEPKSVIIPAQTDRSVPQQPHCVGKTVDAIAVYYQSKPGFVGQDSFRYLRLNPRDAGDGFNKEINYTITVK
jgi:flagellar biosynthesis/type III secretory pathway ATPase